MNTSKYNERLKTTGRNDPCPCGSGQKYKKCHLAEDEAAKHAEMAKAAEEREAALGTEDPEENTEGGGTRGVRIRRNAHQHDGKASSGQNRHTNIPRRGAV